MDEATLSTKEAAPRREKATVADEDDDGVDMLHAGDERREDWGAISARRGPPNWLSPSHGGAKAANNPIS